MNRRAAVALFAVSLTMLPACVTVVQEPVATEPEAASSTQTQPTTRPVQPTTNIAISRTLRRDQDQAAREVFYEALETSVFPGEAFGEDRLQAMWEVALQACAEFDTNIGAYDWAQSVGLNLDGPLGVQEENFLAVVVVGVASVCPEHFRIPEEIHSMIR